MSHQQIRERAYYLWVQRGRPIGQPLQDWLSAEQQHLQSLQLLYDVQTSIPQWGGDLVLAVDQALSGLNFGSHVTPPCRVVLTGAARSVALHIRSWTSTTITAVLPAKDPNFTPWESPNLYKLTVDTTTATAIAPRGEMIAIGPLEQTLLFTVDALAHWGRTATLRVLDMSPLKLPDPPPAVTLVGASSSKTLTTRNPTATTLDIELPSYDPAFTPVRAPSIYSLHIDTPAGRFKPLPDGNFSITLPGPNLCDVSILESALRELLAVNASTLELPTLTPPSEPGKTDEKLSRLNVTLLKGPGFDAPRSEEAKLLKELVTNNLIKLAFGFKTATTMDQARFSKPMRGTLDTTLARILEAPLSVISDLVVVPNIAAMEDAVDIHHETWQFQVEVNVTLSGLPGCEGVTGSLRTPPIKVLPIALPTIVAAFDEKHFMGPRVIVFLRPELASTLAFKTVYDRNRRGARESVDRLFAALRLVSQVVRLLPEEWRTLGLPGDPLAVLPRGTSVLPDFIQKILEKDNDDLVVVGESVNKDIGHYSPGWNDVIGSLLMIGVANGVTTFKLFENWEFGGAQLHVRMRADHVAGSYWTLHESAFLPKYRDSFDSPGSVPEPGTHQNGEADKYPWGHYYNVATGFRWEGP